MNRTFIIRWLLAISVIASLALAPLSRSAMAQMASGTSMPAMADEMTMTAADEMQGDIPCCPSKTQAPVDCDKCVFAAACMSNSFAGMPVTGFHLFFIASATIVPDRNVFQPDGLGRPPPEHPPRILV